MVDLSELKVGDKVRFRNGSTSLEVSGFSIKDSASDFPYVIVFEDGCRLSYKKDGSYFNYKFDDNDIIEIIPQSKEESDKPKVDLSTLNVGDIVKFRNGSSSNVKDISVRDYTSTFPYLVFFENENEKAYTKDGFFISSESIDGRDIVEIIHQEQQTVDPVNHPSHYASGGIECIEAIKASMTAEAYRGFLKGNVLKYLWRYESKGKPVEDLKKAKTYLTWLIKENGE